MLTKRKNQIVQQTNLLSKQSYHCHRLKGQPTINIKTQVNTSHDDRYKTIGDISDRIRVNNISNQPKTQNQHQTKQFQQKICKQTQLKQNYNQEYMLSQFGAIQKFYGKKKNGKRILYLSKWKNRSIQESQWLASFQLYQLKCSNKLITKFNRQIKDKPFPFYSEQYKSTFLQNKHQLQQIYPTFQNNRVEQIIGKKIQNYQIFYLIKWLGFPIEKSVWCRYMDITVHNRIDQFNRKIIYEDLPYIEERYNRLKLTFGYYQSYRNRIKRQKKQIKDQIKAQQKKQINNKTKSIKAQNRHIQKVNHTKALNLKRQINKKQAINIQNLFGAQVWGKKEKMRQKIKQKKQKPSNYEKNTYNEKPKLTQYYSSKMLQKLIFGPAKEQKIKKEKTVKQQKLKCQVSTAKPVKKQRVKKQTVKKQIITTEIKKQKSLKSTVNLSKDKRKQIYYSDQQTAAQKPIKQQIK